MNQEMKNVFESFANTLYMSKFYLNHYKKLENFWFWDDESEKSIWKDKWVVWHYFNLIHTATINNMYLYLLWLIEKPFRDSNKKTIAIKTLLSEYRKELWAELYVKYENKLNEKENIINNIINKRHKIIGHFDLEIAKKWPEGEKEFINENETVTKDINKIINLLEDFLSDVEKKFNYTFQNKVSYSEITEYSGYFMDDYIIPLISNDIKIHNNIIDNYAKK